MTVHIIWRAAPALFSAALTAAAAAPAAYPGSILAWDYPASVTGLRGFECRAQGRIIGQAGPRARAMPLRLSSPGEQEVLCAAIGANGARSEDASLVVVYNPSAATAPPEFFCLTLDDNGALCELSWTYPGNPSEFVLKSNGKVVGKAGPSAAVMPCPPLIAGAQVLELAARSEVLSPTASITLTNPQPDGVICDGD